MSRALGQHTSLFEAEISGPAGDRGTDDHVIQHLDLQEPGAFGEPASQASVRFTWRWIATMMAVLCELKGYVILPGCHACQVSGGLV